jgi:steroid Delta-isomerase
VSTPPVLADQAAAYARFYETLTPERLGQLDTLCAPDVRFVDPFNDLRGLSDLYRVFDHMFTVLEAPKFVIEDTALSPAAAYFKWTFTARAKGRASMPIHLVGMSEVRFAPSGLIIEHIDHWDAASQLYARLPVIGGAFRWLGRRFAVPEG